jgi:hypothetical protein
MEKFIVFRPVHSWNCRRRRVWNHNKQSDPDKRGRDKNISKNLETVLSTNSADKLLMAQFYAAVTRSDEIRKRWEIYRDELKNEIDAAKVQLKEIASEIQHPAPTQ